MMLRIADDEVDEDNEDETEEIMTNIYTGAATNNELPARGEQIHHKETQISKSFRFITITSLQVIYFM